MTTSSGRSEAALDIEPDSLEFKDASAIRARLLRVAGNPARDGRSAPEEDAPARD